MASRLRRATFNVVAKIPARIRRDSRDRDKAKAGVSGVEAVQAKITMDAKLEA